MRKYGPHIIKKVTADLSLPTENEQAKRSAQVKDAVIQAVQKLTPLLDEYYETSFYRLDLFSVELNVREADLPHLDILLEEALAKKIIQLEGENSIRPETEMKEENTIYETIEAVSPEIRIKVLMTFFLQEGQLPWWAGPESMSQMEDWLHEVTPDKWRAFLESMVNKNPTAIKRLVVQFPKLLIYQLIKKLANRGKESAQLIPLLHEIDEFLETLDLTPGTRLRIGTELLAETINALIDKEKGAVLLSRLINTATAEIEEHPPYNVKKSADFSAVNLWEKWVRKSESDHRHEWLFLAGKSKLQKSEIKAKPEKRLEVKQGTEKDGITVENCGLVLLHPFIDRLFVNLGLIEEGKFVSNATRERAVCLLHYLATGATEFPEPALVLPKFLCDWPIDQPVNRFLPISDYEKEECDNVLNSCINHWRVLKSTPISGLQTGFLQRDGVLKNEEFGWSLYVEKKTQDILLDKLSWGLSMIKFNWMENMLTIKWK